ncbi:hypothetical protein V5O48_000819 [Marasmius crinis-equi]|uniref:Uncharacterized protein n=1 Tax=Marasmius crinis-equi TaxID=585013 RepID=A0ABR3G070_9AGAR
MSNSASLDDAKAIQALLVQLGASQAMKEVFDEKATSSSNSQSKSRNTPDSGSSTSVASLLSQLQTPQQEWIQPIHQGQVHQPQGQSQPRLPASEANSQWQQGRHTSQPPSGRLSAISIPDSYENADNDVALDGAAAANPPSQDLRQCTFQQALPILAELSTRKELVDALVAMKKSQDTLEKQLSEERKAIREKYDRRIKDASVKARLIGAGLSPHEARMLNDGYKEELKKFDRGKAISAWESLVSQQQEDLSMLGVPTMFLSGHRSDRETQQKVAHVLEGLIGSTES